MEKGIRRRPAAAEGAAPGARVGPPRHALGSGPSRLEWQPHTILHMLQG